VGISPDFGRTLWFNPVQQFVQVQADQITDALNALINDFNAAVNVLGVSGSNYLGAFAYASLPASPTVGSTAYCTNGRKVAEGGGSGTGVLVYYSNSAWRVFSSDAPVTT
jgi:hypothetical protein